MTFTITPLHWRIVQTAIGAEWHVTMQLLKNLNIEAIFPYTLRSSYRAKTIQGMATALFPGYIFAGLDPSQSIDDITRLQKVRTVLRCGRELIRLTEAQVSAIHKQASEARNEIFVTNKTEVIWKIGEFVPIPTGPMAGYPALIEEVDSEIVRGTIGSFTVTWPVATPPYSGMR